MDYTMAMNYINEKTKLGIVPGLVNVKELLRRLDNPQNKVKCLHIAGTNGKGSIFAYLQEILIEAGYKVGRYISPTIFTYLERFQINKEYMSQGEFSACMDVVSKKVDEMMADGFASPTAFEIETAVAFLYFYQKKVDYVLVECGMGGLYDATNVIDNPYMVVLASISMDHMGFLGDSLEEIALQKVGIIKDKTICVSYPQEGRVEALIREKCEQMNAKFTGVDLEKVKNIENNLGITSFFYGDSQYKTELMGWHQVYNAATAIVAAELIPGIDRENIVTGIEKTRWQGRMTKISDKPLTYVDGAHNENAWLALKDTINKYFTNRRIIYIIGVLKDKEYEKMVKILKDTMYFAVAITPDSPRGLDKKILAGILRDNDVQVTVAADSEEALRLAKNKAGDEDVIMVCGSLSFLSEYLQYGGITS